MKSFFTVANILTSTRIILTIPYIIFYVQKNWIMILVSLLIFVIAGITDFLDGYFARLSSQETNFGRFFDPLADKILIVSVLITQLIIHPHYYPFWLIIILIVRDFVISDFRMYKIEQKDMIKTLILAKIKTALLFFTIIATHILYLLDCFFIEHQSTNFIDYINSKLYYSGTILSYIPLCLLILASYFSLHSAIEYFVRNIGRSKNLL